MKKRFCECYARQSQVGASEHLLKGMKTENIPAAIRTVDAGRSHIPPVIVKNYNRSMQYASPIFNEQIPSLPPLPAP